jgi:hypothetical protein
MKMRTISALSGLTLMTMLMMVLACEQPQSNREVADQALAVLQSLRGAASYVPHEDGNFGGTQILGIDSFYIDDTTCGIRTVGWIYWDDNNTPSDTLDDTFTFVGLNEYLDWGFSENWFLSVKVNHADRETEMAVKNNLSEESLYVHFDSVNRPGGVQYGPGTFVSPYESIDVTMGIHHAETPDNYDDNYSWLEFFLIDAQQNIDNQFWVHADFRPNNSGSGEIRLNDCSGDIIATFEWDEFGRGTLVVDGGVYPFEW